MDKFSELKAAALAATPGPWEQLVDNWSDGDDALISCDSRDGMVAIAKIEGGGNESGYDEPFSSEQQANAAFIAAANPATVLALLAELKAKDKRIAELSEGKVGNALLERENHHVEVVDKLLERIAELEAIATDYAGKFQKAQDAAKHLIIMNDSAQAEIARLKSLLAAPVRLPGMADAEAIPALKGTHGETALMTRNAVINLCAESIRAAGFTVEGDE